MARTASCNSLVMTDRPGVPFLFFVANSYNKLAKDPSISTDQTGFRFFPGITMEILLIGPLLDAALFHGVSALSSEQGIVEA